MVSTRAVLCLVLALFAIGVASFGTPTSTIPVLLWSDSKIFSTSQVVDTVTSSDVEYVLGSLFNTKQETSTKLASTINTKQTPEVVVLFIEPHLTTDQISQSGASYSHLKTAVESAGSSLSLPYTIAASSLFDDAIIDIADSLKVGSVFVSRLPGSGLFAGLEKKSDVKVVEINALLEELKSSNVYSNGVTDLVLVCFDERYSEAAVIFHDEYIGSISEGIRTATKGNYVAMYSANMPSSSSMVWSFDQQFEEEYSYSFRSEFATLANCTVNCTNSTNHKTNYFPGPLLEAYIIIAILLAMLFTGGCAIFSLQTPDRWEAPKAKKEHY